MDVSVQVVALTKLVEPVSRPKCERVDSSSASAGRYENWSEKAVKFIAVVEAQPYVASVVHAESV